jgi:hypothetical protein
LLYETIYVSYPFEDVGVLDPSLLVAVTNPKSKDCKIRINVYYSSSLTNGKEILLAATSFGLREFLRHPKRVFTSSMVSEHCSEALAQLRRILPLPPILHTEAVQANSPPKPWNPMFRRYIFQQVHDVNNPIVCEEFTWEPRLCFKSSLIFLKNFSLILGETITAWRVRKELERARQGRFKSREEAFLNGWFELSVSVDACAIFADCVVPLPSEEIVPPATGEDGSKGQGGGGARPEDEKERDGRSSVTSVSAARVRKSSASAAIKMPSVYVEITLEHMCVIILHPLILYHVISSHVIVFAETCHSLSQ